MVMMHCGIHLYMSEVTDETKKLSYGLDCFQMCYWSVEKRHHLKKILNLFYYNHKSHYILFSKQQRLQALQQPCINLHFVELVNYIYKYVANKQTVEVLITCSSTFEHHHLNKGKTPKRF